MVFRGKGMDKKKITVYGIVFLAIQIIMSLKIFVTYSEMAAYAAPKKDITTIEERLIRIENKLDKIIMGY